MPLVSASEWDQFLTRVPDAHLLQTATWGELKTSFGWKVVRLVRDQVGAQVLFRRLPLGLTIAYLPRGPVSTSGPVWPSLDDSQIRIDSVMPAWGAFWSELDELCQDRRAVFLKVEPDVWEISGVPSVETAPEGFHPSAHAIQPPRTILVDLRGEDERLLGRMKQKTRYNIRLALRKGVVVRPWADLEAFYDLMQVTGERDEFGVHSLAYYTAAYELFHPRGECELLLAEYEREPLAALMVFAHGARTWYFYGASADVHRDRMPAYLLQWEAMRWARAQGCTLYDLWGVPDEPEQVLEEQFNHRTSGLWGVYRFKRGFGGQLSRALGPWDRVYHPTWYAFYSAWMNMRRLDR